MGRKGGQKVGVFYVGGPGKHVKSFRLKHFLLVQTSVTNILFDDNFAKTTCDVLNLEENMGHKSRKVSCSPEFFLVGISEMYESLGRVLPFLSRGTFGAWIGNPNDAG